METFPKDLFKMVEARIISSGEGKVTGQGWRAEDSCFQIRGTGYPGEVKVITLSSELLRKIKYIIYYSTVDQPYWKCICKSVVVDVNIKMHREYYFIQPIFLTFLYYCTVSYTSYIHLVLNLPLDGIIINHFYSGPAEYLAFFLISVIFLKCRNYIELFNRTKNSRARPAGTEQK